MNAKQVTTEFTGTVTEATLVEATVYGSNYSNDERYARSLKVTIETDDRQTVQFYSPSVQIVVSCPAGCPIAVVICEENDWIKKVQRENEPKVIGQNIESRLKVGDLITVTGRVKKTYNKLVTINYTKLIKLVPMGGKVAPRDYAFNPGDCVVICDAQGKQIETTHRSNNFGWLAGNDRLTETLQHGYAHRVPFKTIEALRDNPSDPDGHWLNHLLNGQESYYLACWLGNRREKPIIKKP